MKNKTITALFAAAMIQLAGHADACTPSSTRFSEASLT